VRGEIQVITTYTPLEYRTSSRTIRWLGSCFRAVNVPPLDEKQTLRVLYAYKDRYEKFHAVTYTDDAIAHAVYCAKNYIPEGQLLSKAMDVLDRAGVRVKLRQSVLPEEVTEVQKRIKFIVHRMENSIANHEFEKARFYSDEECKERDNLNALRQKYHLNESSTGVVGPKEIDEVISRWSGLHSEVIGAQPQSWDNPSNIPASPIPKAETVPRSTVLRVFLCHSSQDKPAVRDLYQQLKQNGVDPWLDEENLLPGQDWDYEISEAVRSSHIVIVCLSATSVTKAGYVQREIRKVLDVADEQPEGAIYLIPLRLEDCEVPARLRRWHWVSLFEPRGLEKLMQALRERAREVGLNLE
jgi:hypothetical protein